MSFLSSHVDADVVGADAAGLAAAQRLKTLGHTVLVSGQATAVALAQTCGGPPDWRRGSRQQSAPANRLPLKERIVFRPWLFLIGAVSAEVCGVVVMKLASDSNSFTTHLFVYAMIGLSFYLLSTTMKYVSMAVSYAAWETMGLISIAAIGVRFFGETLGILKLAGMALLLIGVVMVNAGSPKAAER